MQSFPSIDDDFAQMRTHRGVQVASEGAHLRGGLIGWRRDDPDFYDLRKGSVVTVELLTTVYVA